MSRIGERHLTKRFGYCTIVGYENSSKVTVRFENGTEVIVPYGDVKRGLVKNPCQPFVYDIGFVGQGKYKPSQNKNLYNKWIGAFTRCYSQTSTRDKSYDGCSVHPDWHNFQNFCSWAEGQIGFDKTGWQLDKDILVKGNMLYGPDTCCFVPNEINNLFHFRDKQKLGGLPLGVFKLSNRYRAQWNEGNKTATGPLVLDIDTAYSHYKIGKENFVKVVTERHKKDLDPGVYEHLINWKVED